MKKWIRAIFGKLPQHNFFFSLLISPLEEVLFFSLFFSSSQNKIIYFFHHKKNVFFLVLSTLSKLPFFFQKKLKSINLVLWPKNILLNFLCTTMIDAAYTIRVFRTFFYSFFAKQFSKINSTHKNLQNTCKHNTYSVWKKKSVLF